MWTEAAASAFVVASALPSMVDASRVAELFVLLEQGNLQTSNLQLPDVASVRNQNGETLLMVAARVGQLDVVNYLLSDSDIDDTDYDGWTALLNAAHQGHAEIVSVLLHAGAAVDILDLMGWSPLMWAVYKNHYTCVEILLSHKAHVNLIDEEDGLTPLIMASARGFADVVRQLLAYGAEVNACDKFGSTALIWAARKGYIGIVELLLNAGAEVDAIGMYSSTALILATRGNYINVVELLLSREPNVNVTEQGGMSALGIAAREGYAEIAEMLVYSGAYVNVVDRFGNSILACSIRSGNLNIVRMLLDKHADVNVQDSEKRTPLHLAIDKSYTDMVLAILEKKPNLELKNKDGDTALIRAVKNRNVALCQLLVSAGSKISATDNNGDNPLHLALRARSKRMTQSLLANPSDSRLLYRPNRIGQTPYFIDQCHPQPIIPLIFGPVDSEIHMDAMFGYNIYSNVLADIACEPNLTLPLTIGLYAKWGSGKSILLAKLKDSMSSFSRSWLDGVQLSWSWSLVFSLAICITLLTLTGVSVVAVTRQHRWVIIVASLGASLFVGMVTVYGVIYYGSEVKAWNRSVAAGRSIARLLARIRLFLSVILLEAPARMEKDLLMCPVSFLFADYHRLSSVGGEQAIAKIVTTLFEAAENHFGSFSVRILCALRTPHPRGNRSRFRRACGIPVILLAIIYVLSLVTALICLSQWLLATEEHRRRAALSYLYSAISLFGFCLLLSIYPLYIIFFYCLVNVPKKKVNFAAQRVHKLQFEGFMQKLQHEVDLITAMISSLDAFTSSQTRLVVLVDGLDNCEQERMIQTLDALELLFSARVSRPFLVTIAVDPHIIVSAINHSMHTALAGTELTGHDYLKNIVNMPFYLHNSALRQLQTNLREKKESLAAWKERFKRQDTFHGSYLSLKESEGRATRKATMLVGTRGLSQCLMTDDYFSNMNPRAVKRIVNALTLTGRLMRAFEIEFSWVMLGYWISLIEQWPSRMCWLIDRAADVQQDHLSLAQVYHQVKEKIPKKDSLIGRDRNPDNFEPFLEQACIPGPDQLTVGHVRRFVPCTSNLDPYLRKLIRERRLELEGPAIPEEDVVALEKNIIFEGPLKYLFKDETIWSSVRKPLIEMRIDDIIRMVRQLDIAPERMEMLVQKIRGSNLNGLVLSTCDLNDVQQTLKLSLGDWTLLKLLIEGLRKWEPSRILEKRMSLATVMPRSTSLASIQETKNTVEVQEVEDNHQWLMDSLSGMDKVETEGDVDVDVVSRTPSIRFDDEGAATDADSTESMCGSQENLLDSPSASQIHSSLSIREEMMRRMRTDSIHSGKSNGGISRSSRSTALSTGDDNQLTVRKRTATDDKLLAMDIFDRNPV